ncbi:unnamed protein product [Pieris macdunnoughi]|uniref:Uncharacterized protein n=1 Tax=Pieris macdunnoughi TaxID=345717 RepID=A0A821XBN8_9NEOP|nr:unnamed protein product [Pieris macdunnoughi]
MLQKSLEEEKFKEKVEAIKDRIEIDWAIEHYTRLVLITCDKTIPKIKDNQKLKIAWWSDELERLKKEAATKKRRIRCA